MFLFSSTLRTRSDECREFLNTALLPGFVLFKVCYIIINPLKSSLSKRSPLRNMVCHNILKLHAFHWQLKLINESFCQFIECEWCTSLVFGWRLSIARFVARLCACRAYGTIFGGGDKSRLNHSISSAEKCNPSTSCISWFMSLSVPAIWSIPLGQSKQRRQGIRCGHRGCANFGTWISVINWGA